MRVKVVKLRENGQRQPKDRLTLAQAIEGDLEVIQYVNTPRSYSVARLSIKREFGMLVTEATLYDPKLTKIEGNVLLFDGLEKIGDRLVLHHWNVLVKRIA